MGTPSGADFFNAEAAQAYDERNRRLAPIADNMHFLIRLVLRACPEKAHVLCVGVGTGAEILSLAKTFPAWTFVGIDPSQSMLEVCRHNLQAAGVLARCELVHGYVDDAPKGLFDAALSILVTHFVKPEDKQGFFNAMTSRMRPGGILVNTEISADVKAETFAPMLHDWAGMQGMAGATPEALAGLSHQIREVLSVVPPEETERLLRQSGIGMPVRFFQSFLICGWHGKKAG